MVYSGGGGQKRGLLLDLRGCNGVAQPEREKEKRGVRMQIYIRDDEKRVSERERERAIAKTSLPLYSDGEVEPRVVESSGGREGISRRNTHTHKKIKGKK